MAQITKMESLKTFYDIKFVPVRRLVCGYVTVISMVVFFTITSPVVAYVNVSISARYVIGAITIVLYLSFLIMAIPFKWLGGTNDEAQLYLTRDGSHSGKQQVEGEVQDVVESNEPIALDQATSAPVSSQAATRTIATNEL